MVVVDGLSAVIGRGKALAGRVRLAGWLSGWLAVARRQPMPSQSRASPTARSRKRGTDHPVQTPSSDSGHDESGAQTDVSHPPLQKINH